MRRTDMHTDTLNFLGTGYGYAIYRIFGTLTLAQDLTDQDIASQ